MEDKKTKNCLKYVMIVPPTHNLNCNSCGQEVNFCSRCRDRFFYKEEIFCDKDNNKHYCLFCGKIIIIEEGGD